jgi:hypothetical protein
LNGLEVRVTGFTSPLDGTLDAVVLAEVGAPSAIAQDELSAGRGPPCAEAAGTLGRPGDAASVSKLPRAARIVAYLIAPMANAVRRSPSIGSVGSFYGVR